MPVSERRPETAFSERCDVSTERLAHSHPPQGRWKPKCDVTMTHQGELLLDIHRKARPDGEEPASPAQLPHASELAPNRVYRPKVHSDMTLPGGGEVRHSRWTNWSRRCATPRGNAGGRGLKNLFPRRAVF